MDTFVQTFYQYSDTLPDKEAITLIYKVLGSAEPLRICIAYLAAYKLTWIDEEGPNADLVYLYKTNTKWSLPAFRTEVQLAMSRLDREGLTVVSEHDKDDFHHGAMPVLDRCSIETLPPATSPDGENIQPTKTD